VTDSAFGSVRAHSGVATEWTYTGEQSDPNGLAYLRARYYDPPLGRFLSRDPAWAGHPYVYVGNNPVNSVDPSGLDGDEPIPFPLPLNPEEVEAKCTEEFEICRDYVRARGIYDAVPFVCVPLFLDCLKSKTAFFDRSVYEDRFGSFPKVSKGGSPYFSNLLGWLKMLNPGRWRLPLTGTGGYLSSDKEGGGSMCGSWRPFGPVWSGSWFGWRGIW